MLLLAGYVQLGDDEWYTGKNRCKYSPTWTEVLAVGNDDEGIERDDGEKEIRSNGEVRNSRICKDPIKK